MFSCGGAGITTRSSADSADPVVSTVREPVHVSVADSVHVSVADSAYVERLVGSTAAFEMIPVSVEGRRLWMSRTEITWDVYDVWVFGLDARGAADSRPDASARPSKPYVLPGDAFGHAGMPALGMTAAAAREFAVWLSAKTGRAYRLPTLTEWRSVCRSAMDGIESLDDVAWHRGNSDRKTHSPGTRTPLQNGPVDMLGNAAEWVVAEEGAVAAGGSFRTSIDRLSCELTERQTAAWNATDPQLPKSSWWLSDAPFVSIRVLRDE